MKAATSATSTEMTSSFSLACMVRQSTPDAAARTLRGRVTLLRDAAGPPAVRHAMDAEDSTLAWSHEKRSTDLSPDTPTPAGWLAVLLY
jgi:hypothetical protein